MHTMIEDEETTEKRFFGSKENIYWLSMKEVYFDSKKFLCFSEMVFCSSETYSTISSDFLYFKVAFDKMQKNMLKERLLQFKNNIFCIIE